MLQRACALGLEGIVSKASQSVYVSGRGKSWVKSKCSAQQEFVIAGYVPSTTGRKAIGSLAAWRLRRPGPALCRTRRHRLFLRRRRGAVHAARRRCASARVRSPSALTTAEARQVRFVRPELIAEVDFRGWTGDGLLRQASFQGLREDKPAREVVRETTMATNAAPERPKSSVTLTHPDRVYWPDVGVTKEGLADYYAEAWPFMKPLIVGRALALVRCPDGIGGQTFFQKHAWKGLNRNIVLVKDPKEPEPLISIRDFDGLMALVQSAALEIHPWGSTVTDWERPDMIVMDLDPGDDVDWTSVIAAAEEVRDRLKNAGLSAFVKTSGGKGLHVVSPVKPKAEWPAVKAFTKSIADSMAADSPGPLRLDDPEGAAPRQDPDRLSAQSARHDRGLRLFHPRQAGRRRFDAPRLGGANARNRAGLFHHPQRAGAPFLVRRSLGGFRRRRGADRGRGARRANQPESAEKAGAASGSSASLPRRRFVSTRP